MMRMSERLGLLTCSSLFFPSQFSLYFIHHINKKVGTIPTAHFFSLSLKTAIPLLLYITTTFARLYQCTNYSAKHQEKVKTRRKKMAEQVEKTLLQEPKTEAIDVPEEAERINKQDENNQSFLVPEAESTPVNSLSCVSEHEPPMKLADAIGNEENTPNQDVKETTKISDLSEDEKQALQELKILVQDALNKHEFGFSSSSPKEEAKPVPAKDENETEKGSFPEQEVAKTVVEDDGAKTLEAIEETIVASSHSNIPTQEKPSLAANAPDQEVFIWGVKLMEDEKTDVILLKFLRARDFKVQDAFNMIKNTIKWRKDFGIDQLLQEDLGISGELERAVFMHGYSKEGSPVCYNVYGEFQNRELYQKMLSDEDKRQRFLRWRVQFLEKSITRLDLRPGGISTIVQVNDLKNSPGINKWELRQATKQALQLLQDNYPEFLAKQVFINVPWWYLALNKLISPFLTQRTKSKFVVAGPSKSTETLFKYISAEQVPSEYSGLSSDGDFGIADGVTEIMLKSSAKHIVEFPVTQTCYVTWEAKVVGWEVSYGAEFVPSAENGYTIIVQKAKKMGSNQEHVICTSYQVDEPGKIVLTFTNLTSKKKKLLYRFKIKLSVD